jgi:hypothetical protein
MKIFNSDSKVPAVIISFFFHDIGIPSEKTFSSLLHVLLYQLLTECPNLISADQLRIQRLRRRSTVALKGESFWSETELQGAIWDIQQCIELKRKILCVIDGLDECEAKSLPEMLQFPRNYQYLRQIAMLVSRFYVRVDQRIILSQDWAAFHQS